MSVNEGDYYALSSRLKTKRRKKQLQKKDLDKQLIALQKELGELREKEKQLEYRELNPPIQRGWKRYFVLRSDIQAGPYQGFFQSLLDKINKTDYCRRKDFKIRKVVKGKRILEDVIPSFQELSLDTFLKYNFSDKEAIYFRQEWRTNKFTNRRYKCYVFTDPWLFVPRIVPNIIYREQVLDTVILQRKAEIKAFLSFDERNIRLGKVLHGYYKYRDRWNPKVKPKYEFILNPRTLKELLNNYHKENLKNE